MMRYPTLILAGLLGIVAAAQAEENKSLPSCVEDVAKLCSKATGSADELGKCLATNRDQLTNACRKAVEENKG